MLTSQLFGSIGSINDEDRDFYVVREHFPHVIAVARTVEMAETADCALVFDRCAAGDLIE